MLSISACFGGFLLPMAGSGVPNDLFMRESWLADVTCCKFTIYVPPRDVYSWSNSCVSFSFSAIICCWLSYADDWGLLGPFSFIYFSVLIVAAKLLTVFGLSSYRHSDSLISKSFSKLLSWKVLLTLSSPPLTKLPPKAFLVMAFDSTSLRSYCHCSFTAL